MIRKHNTFPVFINYDKQDDISDTTKYEDHFTSYNRLMRFQKVDVVLSQKTYRIS